LIAARYAGANLAQYHQGHQIEVMQSLREHVMFLDKQIRGLVISLVMYGAAGLASAASIDSSGAGASALRGAPASPTFTVNFGTASSPYDLVALNFDLTYDSAVLTFNPDASTITYNGASTVGINTVLNQLAPDSGSVCAGNSCSSSVPGIFTVGWFTLGSVALNAPVTLTAAFIVSPGAAIGSSSTVSLTGTSGANVPVSTDFPFGVRDDNYLASAAITVTAVPEPEGWLMLLAGLGLIATLGRRRLSARL
jgi:hypothetical protein